MELKESEIICDKCKGSGNSISHHLCSKCWGDGKMDWIENIVGKKQSKFYFITKHINEKERNDMY